MMQHASGRAFRRKAASAMVMLPLWPGVPHSAVGCCSGVQWIRRDENSLRVCTTLLKLLKPAPVAVAQHCRTVLEGRGGP